MAADLGYGFFLSRARPKDIFADIHLPGSGITAGSWEASNYEGMEPLYTEYNIGHFTRSFSLSQSIDQKNIGASLNDGVLTITLKKVERAQPRRIEIG